MSHKEAQKAHKAQKEIAQALVFFVPYVHSVPYVALLCG